MLRDYQIADREAIRAAFRGGARAVLYCLPTGGGKTTTAADIVALAAAKGSRTLFFAHRKELIDQASSRFDQFGIAHGVIMADHPRRRPEEPVQVASIQTLSRRRMPWTPALIIVDECHRVKGASYLGLLAQFPEAKIIGLTATPIRADGKGLKPPFDALVLGPSVQTLTDLGYLVPVLAYAKKKPDLRGVRSLGGDYKLDELELAMNKPEIVGDVVKEWSRHANGRQTVAFAVGVAHSKALCAAWQAAGVACEHLDGETSKEAREAILARLASGETTVVSNCQVLTEGWDCPAVSAISVVRPTQSLGLFLQMSGRVLRPAGGKTNCILLDHGGNVYRYGLPADPREWELSFDRPKKQGPRTKDVDDCVRVCPECEAVNKKEALTCACCGYEFFRRDSEVVHKPGELALVKSVPRANESERKRAYFWFLHEQHTNVRRDGSPYKPTYAFAKFIAKFGERPARGWKAEWVEANQDLYESDRLRRLDLVLA